MLKRGHGNWVEGESFWDREAELSAFEDYLEEGAHLLIVAPRRIGKTSLLHEAKRRLSERYVYLIADLQKCHSAEDLVVELSVATRQHRTLWARTREVFRNALASIRDQVDEVGIDEISVKIRGSVGSDWQPRATRLVEEIAGAEDDVVICLDELPILVNRLITRAEQDGAQDARADADALMSWLRAMSIAHKGRIRFVLCGSIGFEPVLGRVGLSGTLNAYTAFRLEPWPAVTAKGCLDALAASYQITWREGATDRIVELLGSCIPHHVQLFFDLIYEDLRRRGQTDCAAEDVTRIYEAKMLSSRGHAELSQLEERLREVLGVSRMPLAIDLLTEAATTGALTAEVATLLASEHRIEEVDPAPELRRILGILQHDGYLEPQAGSFVFASRLLRDWWKARFEFTYRPVAERKTS